MTDAVPTVSGLKVLAVFLFLLNTERTCAFQIIEDKVTKTTIPTIPNLTSFTNSPLREAKDGNYVTSVQNKNIFSQIIFITYNLSLDNINSNSTKFAVNEAQSLYVDAAMNFDHPEIYFVLKLPFYFDRISWKLLDFLRTEKPGLSTGMNSSGASITIDRCLNAKSVDGLEDFWSYLNFILFHVEIKQEILRCGATTAVGCIEGKMRKCARMLSKLPAKKIFYEISEDYDSLKHLHTEVFSERQWKMPVNVEILIRDYRDKFRYRKKENDTKNWIKLGKKLRTNLTYYKHTAHQLHERNFKNLEEGADKNPLNSTCLQTSTSSQNPAPTILANKSQITRNNICFNGSHFAVGFNPRLMEFSGYSEFDAYDLYPFIELISTKFRNIFAFFSRDYNYKSELKYWYTWHLENFLVAVATFNRDKIRAKNTNETTQIPTLQVFVEVELESGWLTLVDEEETTVATVKKFVASANKIFKGTIPYILLKGTDRKESNTEFIMSQIICITQRANKDVGIGATFDLRDCDFRVFVLKILPFVVFRKLPSENDVERGATAFLHYLKHEFNICLQRIREKAPNCGVGLQTNWPDTDINGEKNITALTWLWTSLNDFAVQENVTVFIESAFDESKSKYNQYTGWWELNNPQPCYAGTNDLQFLEKRLHPEKYIGVRSSKADQVTDMIKLGEKLIHLKFVKEELENNLPGKPSLFKREQFGVGLFFDELFYGYDGSDYSRKDIRNLVALVHTRFSQVLISMVYADSIISQQPHVYIPEQAAWLNKENAKKFNLKPDKIIQIFIHFEVYDTLRDIESDSIQVAKLLADKANIIFSQTVPYLLMDLGWIREDVKRTEFVMAAKKAINSLKQEKQFLQEANETQSYQLGVLFQGDLWEYEESQRTEKVNWEDLTKYILPHVHIAFIRVSVPEETELFQDKTKQIEKYAAKIKCRYPDITVGVIFDLLQLRPNSTNALVDFWQRVNEYSKINNIPVFMEEAFDNRHYSNGWWRIKSEGSEKYIEEKYLNKATPAEKRDDNQLKIVIGSVSGCVGIVVISFAIYKIYEIKYRRNSYGTLSGLTEVEILEFFAGRNHVDSADAETEFQNEEVDRFRMTHYLSDCAYDESLEIDTNAFTLDDSLNLGSGAYGQVCMGRLFLDGSQVRVAVKRVKSVGFGEEGLTGLRSLLSEIKVLSYLGRHDNIVTLLGAHTGNISKGEVFVFLELCSRGSLHKCLNILRNTEGNTTSDNYTCLEESSAIHDTNLFVKWSLDIAKGMEFLASKHVVHADLATRNVLLDANNKAKICDFGLSRRMMNYQSYVKTHQEPLPWRWMSPESLRLSVFNEKSDVWSFGVTIWEIFTLGNQPFAGLPWTVDFATSLEEDLRLPIPKRKSGPLFEDKNMYPIMQRCWETDPNERPTFQKLVHVLSEE